MKTELLAESVCTKCKMLGVRTNTIIGYEPVSHMFYTLSPDIEYYNKYEDQKEALDDAIVLWLSKLRNLYRIYGVSVHYEFNEAGNLHCHGILSLSEEFAGCDVHLRKVEKIAHDIIGRKWVPHRVASTCMWYDGFDRVYDYLNKSNVFKPKHVEYI